MRFLRYIIVCTCILYLNTLVVAQDYTPFKPIEGTLSKVIYCVFQDSKGYIWIGTESGVSRYDGYGYKHYTKDDGLSDNEIFQIHEDYKGRLWFLTYNGEPTLYDNGKILTSSNTAFLRNIKPGIISRGFVNRNDTIWYISRNNAYMFIKDKLKNITPAPDYNKMYGGFIEVVSHSDKVVLVSKSSVFYPVSNTKLNIPSQFANQLPNTRALHIGNKLIFYKNSTLIIYNVDTPSIRTIAIPIINNINTITYNEKDKKLWLITDANIYQYNLATQEILNTIPVNLPFANYMLTDKENNLWLSSSNNGLYLSHVSSVVNVEHNIPFSNTAAYCLSMYDGSIYAGHNNGEYLIWEKDKATYKRAAGDKRLDKIYSFCNINDKLMAVYGAFIFDANNAEKYKHHNGAKAIACNNKNVYIAFSYQVVKLSLALFINNHYTNYDTALTTIYGKRVNAMLTKGNDTLYLGAIDGLKILVKDNIQNHPKQHLDIFKCSVTKMAINKNKQLFFATAGKGIGILTADKCCVIDKDKGLASNVCNGVYPDGNNTVWVATNKGISKVTFATVSDSITCNIQNYSVVNGLPGGNTNDVLVSNDTIWLATDNGVCFIKKESIGKQHSAPILNIEGVFVNNKPTNFQNHIKLPYTSNNIRITYTGIAYHRENTVVYKYKLVGADTGWSYTSSRTVEYPHLSPGHYTFIISASNSNSEYSSTLKKIAIEITPPFWETSWFISLAILTLISLIILSISLRFKAIKKKHTLENNSLRLQKEKAEFEKENIAYEKQLIELEQKALNLQMNPHFIFNAMNAIKGFYAHNDRDSADSYIDKFAALMRMILEYNTRNTLLLHEEIDMLKAYLELAAIRKDDNFTFSVKVEDNLNIWGIHIPPMLLQPFVENAVIHGIASLPANGYIELQFSIRDNMLQCKVIDNGIGRKKSQAINKFRLHPSKGISITEQRLQLLSPDSRLYIDDVTDSNGQVTGTTVVILLPIIYKQTSA
ncbi:MAG: histidine kinase [Flavipsychrobacter sp.]